MYIFRFILTNEYKFNNFFFNFFFALFRIWKGFDSKSYRLSDSMISYLSLEEKIVTIDSYKIGNKMKVAIGLVNGDVNLWSSVIGDEQILNNIETVDTKLLLTHGDEVTDLAFNQDGSQIVSSGLDKYLYICDIDTGMILFKNEHPNCLICLNWCNGNDILYLGDNIGYIHVWNMLTGEKNCTEMAFNGPITSITSIVMDNKTCNVIAAGVEGNEFLVKAWRNE